VHERVDDRVAREARPVSDGVEASSGRERARLRTRDRRLVARGGTSVTFVAAGNWKLVDDVTLPAPIERSSTLPVCPGDVGIQ